MKIDWASVWEEFDQRTNADQAYETEESLAYNWEGQKELIMQLVNKEIRDAD